MAVSGARILFPGNPWPNGHAIKVARWSGTLAPSGLHFHLHVESANYYAEDKHADEEDVDDNWKSRGVWGNYHSCTLSSTEWGHEGFLVGTPQRPVNLEQLEGKTFRVQKVPGDRFPRAQDRASNAFGIYLLGHDTVCDHRIHFVKRRGASCYDVRWRARVALTYVGNYDLAHRLDAALPKLKLSGIELDSELTAQAGRELFAKTVISAQRYELIRRKFVLRKRV